MQTIIKIISLKNNGERNTVRIRTILYGGAFNMPHIGHRSAAGQTLDYMAMADGYEELWFLPCSSNAFGVKKSVSTEHVVKMLELMVNEMRDPRFSVCVDELETMNGAGPYAVVKELIKKYPERKFCYLIGSDQANSIRSWRNSRKLVMTIPFVTIRRIGKPNWYSTCWYYDKQHVYINDPPTKKQVSSSGIQNDINANWDKFKTRGHEHLPHSVFRYIVANELYKKPNSTA